MKKKIVIWICSTCVLCLAMIAFLVWFIDNQKAKVESSREDVVSDMLKEIDKSPDAVFKVDPNDLPVSGDEGEFEDDELFTPLASLTVPSTTETVVSSEETEPTETSAMDTTGATDPEPEYELRSIGKFIISAVDINIPLWEGAGKVELRYGAGHSPASSAPGQTGNCVIYGHRMRKYGSMFNRLGEVKVGDSIKIQKGDTEYVYIVDQIVTIEPSELSKYIGAEDTGARITLITCTPTGVATHRLIVIGHLA